MKKALAIFLSVLTVILMLCPAVYMGFDSYKQKKDTAEFCSNVLSMNRKYNSLSQIDIIDENGKQRSGCFENRLIALTDKKLRTNEVDSVYGLGYAILQYSDLTTLQSDLKMLKAEGISVCKDYYSCLTENSTADINSSSLLADNVYSFGNCGEVYAKEIISHSSKQLERIVVGVIDTGITYSHPLFQGRLDSVNEPNFSPLSTTTDCTDEHGHGTMVSGIIVQSTPDNVVVRPYKLGDSNGYITESEVIAVYEHILAESDKPDVINMSFGGVLFDEGEREIRIELLRRMYDCGITLCSAAGNDSSPGDYFLPAACEYVINTSACNGSGDFCDFSNYGSSIDICATGDKIFTASNTGGYTDEHSGTSFSAPFVTAACAFVLMQNPSLTPAEVKDKLLSSAIQQASDEEFYYGRGILSFPNLLELDNPYPPPEPSVEGGLYHNEISVSFNVPDGTELYYSFSKMGPALNNLTTSVYTDPITIDSDCVLYYVLVKENEYVSKICSQEYVIQYYTTRSDFSIIAGMIHSYKGDKTNIIVPDDISATSIYRGAFENSNVKSIVLPDKITLLGTEAFKNSSLRKIVARGVTKLNGNGVFSGCTDLRYEEMPSLETVTESAFSGCKHLHEIDFGPNIKSLKTSLFENSGLMHGDFPNAQISSSSNTSVFKNAKLYTLNIPKISELGDSFLYGNSLLYELNSDDIVTMRSNCLTYANLLRNLDVSKVENLYSGGLSGCAISNFYAPLVTGFADSGASFGEYCNCYTVNLPNFRETLGAKAFSRSSTRNFYFENVTQMEEGAFVNTPAVKTMYFPMLTNFYGPKKTSPSLTDQIYQALGQDYNRYPNPEVIWLPSAETISALTVRENGFVYAPNATSLQITNQSENPKSIVMVSDKMTPDGLTVTKANGVEYNSLPAIVSESSSPLNTQSDDYRFITVEDCFYAECIDNAFRYNCDGCEAVVPCDFVEWSKDMINTTSDTSPYLFIFDFTNDNFINAKDFSVYNKKR